MVVIDCFNVNIDSKIGKFSGKHLFFNDISYTLQDWVNYKSYCDVLHNVYKIMGRFYENN